MKTEIHQIAGSEGLEEEVRGRLFCFFSLSFSLFQPSFNIISFPSFPSSLFSLTQSFSCSFCSFSFPLHSSVIDLSSLPSGSVLPPCSRCRRPRPGNSWRCCCKLCCQPVKPGGGGGHYWGHACCFCPGCYSGNNNNETFISLLLYF